MAHHADAVCVLKVNIHCELCKMKTMRVINSIVGVYRVSIDGEKGLAKISGQVNPQILMNAIGSPAAKCAELVRLDVEHPKIKENASCSRRLGAGNYHALENSYGNDHVAAGRYLHADNCYGQQQYYPNSYNYGTANREYHAPPYSHHQQGYYPYHDEWFSSCSIM